MTEFSDAYAKAGEIERKHARRELEAEMRRLLTIQYGREWSKGKIAVHAMKMVNMSMRAGKAALN